MVSSQKIGWGAVPPSPDMQSMRTARDGSQLRMGAEASAALIFVRTPWTHCGTSVLLGDVAARAGAGWIAARLSLMGVWRDPSQP